MEILANTSFEETRIAVLEQNRLSELFWERRGTLNIVGNIYKANVEKIVREEMDKAGCLEMIMPTIQPAEIWKETGRWDKYGDLLLKIKEMVKENRMCNDDCILCGQCASNCPKDTIKFAWKWME